MTRPFPGLLQSFVLLMAALALQATAGWVGLRWWPNAELTLLAGVVNLVAFLPVAAVGLLWARRVTTSRQHRPALSPVVLAGMAVATVALTIPLGELGNLMAWILPIPAGLATMFDRLTEADLVTSLFTVSLVAPLTEELLFRGLLLPGLIRRYGTWQGLVLSSLLFAVFHLNPWQALPALAAGLLLGWAYCTTGRIWIPMAMHALFNGTPVILAVWGWLVIGYNTPLGDHAVTFQPWPWLLVGTLLSLAGLAMARVWAPLSRPLDSDTVAE